MRRLIALASLLALVAVACKIETNFGAVIRADGSGIIIIELGMDDEAQGFFSDLVDDPFADTGFSDLPNARQRTERRGDMTFWILEAEVDDITSFQDDIVGAESSLLDTFSITITDELVTVRGTASADETLSEGDFDPALLEESISANVRITMPGSILSHNADSVRGNELTWRVPVVGGTLNIQAESDPRGTAAGGGIPLGLIVALVAVAALGAIYFINKKKGPGAATSAADEGAGTPPPPAYE